jgi:2-oxo-4-hydroxy-4-carboxy--5-ureidoimidazoline (OHCU) decarboxylase
LNPHAMSRPTPLLLLAAALLAADASGQSPFETKPKVADPKLQAFEAEGRRQEFLQDHPDLKAQLEKLRAMSREERQAWLKEHPDAAEKIKQVMAGAEGRGRPPGEASSPAANRDRIAEFAKAHPELKETIEKLKGMTPEERQAWLKEHPDAAEKIEKAKGALRERAENLTPEQREKLKAAMKERFEKLSPEERAELLKKRPELKEKLGEAAK